MSGVRNTIPKCHAVRGTPQKANDNSKDTGRLSKHLATIADAEVMAVRTRSPRSRAKKTSNGSYKVGDFLWADLPQS